MGRGKAFPISKTAEDVIEARKRPEPHFLVVIDGRFLTQTFVRRIRILVHLVREGIEEERLGHGGFLARILGR